MMWLLCDRNGDMGETGVMRTIGQCSMANGSLSSGTELGNNSFKLCSTAHIIITIFARLLLYHTILTSWQLPESGLEVELTVRAAINDIGRIVAWSPGSDSGGCCSGHGVGGERVVTMTGALALAPCNSQPLFTIT